MTDKIEQATIICHNIGMCKRCTFWDKDGAYCYAGEKDKCPKAQQIDALYTSPTPEKPEEHEHSDDTIHSHKQGAYKHIHEVGQPVSPESLDRWLTDEEKQAYEWALNQQFQSVAARYARILAKYLPKYLAKFQHLIAQLETEIDTMELLKNNWLRLAIKREHEIQQLKAKNKELREKLANTREYQEWHKGSN